MTRKPLLVGLAPILALTLAMSSAACGRMSDLESPRTERSMRSADADNLPEPSTVNRPNREAPIDGGVSNPYDGPGNRPQ